MVRRIIAFALIGLGILTYLFFRNYSGTIIPYPFLCYLVGMAMVVGGGVLLIRTPSRKESKEREEINKLSEKLKANGEKIQVDFSKCDIKTNDFTKEQERYSSSRIQMWNAIGGDADKKIKQVEVHQSVIVFKHQNNGKTETFFSGLIPKERVTLMFKLGDKKKTTLYVDRYNRSIYYFDLDFLQN